MLIEARRSYGQKHVRVIDDRYTVKLGTGVTEYEYRILKLLERLGTLPSPRPIDFFTLEGDCKVIVMSTLPGRERQIGHNMGSGDRVRLLRDVWRYMERTNEVMGKSKEIVWDTSGGVMGSAMAMAMAKEISDLDGLRCLRFPLLDGFINHPVELSNFVDEMSNHTPQISSMIPIQRSVLEHLGTSSPITTATAIATTILHPIRFCHMDLHPGNIPIQNNKISGILDWELAGWYTPTLDAFSALKNVGYSKELMKDYATAWDINSQTLRAVRLSKHDLARGAMEWESEVRKMKLLKEGLKWKIRRPRRVVDPVRVQDEPITSKPRASSVSVSPRPDPNMNPNPNPNPIPNTRGMGPVNREGSKIRP